MPDEGTMDFVICCRKIAHTLHMVPTRRVKPKTLEED
jgi:hypothetical protein